MWKLTIEDDEGKQTSLPLAHDEYGVGRADDNAIRLTDRNISRRHASIRKNGQGWVLKDLESYNGTFVNGTRVVGEQALGHSDVVQLGDYRLEMVDEAMLPQAAPVPVGAPAVALAAPMPSPTQQRPNRLVMVVGPTPGAEFPLDREYLAIGRAEDASVSINHSSVSRLHAELFALGNGRYEVVDKQSANGIRINGVELNRGILEAGDALELGDVRLRFVGAGKVFRADMSMTLPAVMGQYASAAPAGAAGAARPTGGTGRVVAVGIGIGVLAIAGVLLAMRPGAKPVEPGAPTVQIEPATAADNAKLAEATALLGKGDVDGAHQKALEIPENSAAREDAKFAEIEGAWADRLFAEAEAQKDLAEKRKLLNRIATTPSVDSGRRKKALELMQAVDAKMAELAAAQNPGVAIAPRPGGNGDPYESPTAPGTPGATAAAAPTTTAKPDATTGQGLPPQGPPDEAAMRRALEGKVWGGKASVDEIKLLRAICSHQGDRACRDRATAMLKQKEAGN
jgi:pSer/pThr/pTyr-binding forkhead associated (FHA) protein